MSIKDIIKLDKIKSNINLTYGEINYIEEYGYVGLYDSDISETDLELKASEINNLFEKANKLLEEISEIIGDQFEY